MKTFDALELPSKFLLMGHSYGGFIAALYAGQRPERVTSLFLASPGGTSSPAVYDPYSMRDMDDLTLPTISASKVDGHNRNRLEKKHPYGEYAKYLPTCLF